jgi:hypothetical protein
LVGVADLKPVFPGFDIKPRKFPGLILLSVAGQLGRYGIHFSGYRVNRDLIGSLLLGSDGFDAGQLSRLGSRQRHRFRAGSEYDVVIVREFHKVTDKL